VSAKRNESAKIAGDDSAKNMLCQQKFDESAKMS